ncbi:MAG: hypothetical protein N2508_14930 [Anaerolineae bacterium]|nr:hypothetical protein [Anaerolineae bacterium]
MNETIRRIVIRLLTLVLLSACAAPNGEITDKLTSAYLCAPGWMCYEDLKYGFALAYPAEWQVAITIDEEASDGLTIIRRHSFTGPQGALDVDIWPIFEPDLKGWLEKHSAVGGADLYPVLEPNARVAGRPAVAFIGDLTTPLPMFTVFVSKGKYVYRLWFTLTCDEEEVEIIRRLLDSFRFSTRPVPAEIPPDVWGDVQRAFKPPRCER